MVITSQVDASLKATDDGNLSLLPAEIAPFIKNLSDKGLKSEQKRFLGAFSICGILSRAAMAAGISTWRHRDWLKESPIYAECFAEASRISNEYLEGLALELASGMRQKPVVSMGKIVTYEPIYDTRLLTVLMKARMPEKYGTKVDVTSNGHSIVKVIDKDTYDAI